MFQLEKPREEMIKTLVDKGIRDERVLKAMRSVPRHKFVPSPLLRDSYRDSPLPIGYQQTISQPYIVAFMTELLQIKKGDKILEVGTGSGYQASILAFLGARVFTIERQKELWDKANQLLKELGYDRIITRHGDGTMGWASVGPFDGIIVTAAGPELPQPLIEQLNIGGRMVIPVGGRDIQKLIVVDKDINGRIAQKELSSVAFVPLIGKKGWEK
jgi:protein-L-isoaspartate(D-aspartate) O-methyltransferase